MVLDFPRHLLRLKSGWFLLKIRKLLIDDDDDDDAL